MTTMLNATDATTPMKRFGKKVERKDTARRTSSPMRVTSPWIDCSTAFSLAASICGVR